MKRFLLIALLMTVFCASFLTGCAEQQQRYNEPAKTSIDKSYCEADDDCICDGIDKATGTCYIGNKEYYEIGVDKKNDCADFCHGITGNLVIVCLDNRCVQQYECLTGAECSTGRCEGNRCVR